VGVSSHEARRDASERTRARAQSERGADDALPSLATLAARGPLVAPGMREVAKGELSIHAGDRARADVAQAGTRDLCARLTFVATAPLSARLEDAAGNALAESAPAQTATLGARGPVCVRKGDVIRVTFDGHASASARVRWVAWGSL
jgi:hypothetical protein